jgi:hypothetical protein
MTAIDWNSNWTDPLNRGLTAIFGQTLSQVVGLPSGWAWQADPFITEVGDASSNQHYATFTPGDYKNFTAITLSFTIVVAKALGTEAPDYEEPSNLGATFGDVLNAVSLPSGWAWEANALTTEVGDASENASGSASSRQHYAVFTPLNPNFAAVRLLLTIVVAMVDGENATDWNNDWNDPLNRTLAAMFGDTLAQVTDLPGGWKWVDILTTAVGDAGNRTHNATFTPANSNFKTVTLVFTIVVARGIIDAPTGLTATFGDTLASVAQSAAFTNWTWVDAGTTPVGNVGIREFTANYAGTANFEARTGILVTITVERGTQHIAITTSSSLTVTVGQPLQIRTDGNYSLFESMRMVGGEFIDNSNYTITQGSTIITFKPEFIASLGEGQQEVEILFQNGTVRISFTVEAASANNGGGNNNICNACEKDPCICEDNAITDVCDACNKPEAECICSLAGLAEWAIALIVIGALLAFGGAFYAACRYAVKKKSQEDDDEE